MKIAYDEKKPPFRKGVDTSKFRPITRKFEKIGCFNVLYRSADGTMMLQNVKTEEIEEFPVRSMRIFDDVDEIEEVLAILKRLTEILKK